MHGSSNNKCKMTSFKTCCTSDQNYAYICTGSCLEKHRYSCKHIYFLHVDRLTSIGSKRSNELMKRKCDILLFESVFSHWSNKLPPAGSLLLDNAALFGVCDIDSAGLSQPAGPQCAGPLSAAPGPASLWSAPAALSGGLLSSRGMDETIKNAKEITELSCKCSGFHCPP